MYVPSEFRTEILDYCICIAEQVDLLISLRLAGTSWNRKRKRLLTSVLT
jgi:hypothetical protein